MKFVGLFLKLMPVWFGVGVLGPVLAELYLRTPLHTISGVEFERDTVYIVCMIFGAMYGFIAFMTGRWI